nr:DUF2867 domain-containing protein [Deinobacterium chartae]
MRALAQGADHIDAHAIESDLELEVFLAGLFAYNPAWVTFLYRVRVVFLGLLGQRTGLPARWTDSRVPMKPGERLSFFTVEDAGRDFWIAQGREAHLTARLAVVQEPGQRRTYRYRLVTVVHLHNLTGRIYLRMILPFHHRIVTLMLRHAATFVGKPA